MRRSNRVPAAVGIPLALLAGVVFVALSPVSVPLLLWSKHVDEKKRQILVGQRRPYPPPRGMYESRRRRAMTGAVFRRKPKTPTSLAPQTDCPLMNLPYEIRQLIWRACIGDGSIHLSKQREAT